MRLAILRTVFHPACYFQGGYESISTNPRQPAVCEVCRRPKAYAARLLQEAAHVQAGASRLNQDRLETTLREMAQFLHKIPALPEEDFTRERRMKSIANSGLATAFSAPVLA
jgi:hypothetical protein